MNNKNIVNSPKRTIMNGISGINKLKPESKIVCNNGINGISKLNPKNTSNTNNKNTNNVKNK